MSAILWVPHTAKREGAIIPLAYRVWARGDERLLDEPVAGLTDERGRLPDDVRTYADRGAAFKAAQRRAKAQHKRSPASAAPELNALRWTPSLPEAGARIKRFVEEDREAAHALACAELEIGRLTRLRERLARDAALHAAEHWTIEEVRAAKALQRRTGG